MSATLLQERYRTIEVIHENRPWTTVSLVADEREAGKISVLKRIAIPPLRAELEPRLEGLQGALDRLQARPHHGVARVLAAFRDARAFHVVMERAPGKNLNDLIESGRLQPGVDEITRAALHIAEALQALVEARQYMALENFGAHMVMVAGDGDIRLVDLALSQYLRPRAVAWEDPSAAPSAEPYESAALRAYGQMLYAMWTRVPWQEGQVVVESEIPETLRPLILGCLRRNQPESYPSIKALLADLQLLEMVHQDDRSTTTWYLPDPPAPPWREAGFAWFTLRSAALSAQFFLQRFLGLDRPRRVVALLLIAILFGLLLVDLKEGDSRTPYRKNGAVVYSASSSGVLQTWSMSSKRLLRTVTLSEPIGAMLYNAKTRRLFLSMPGEHELIAVDVENDRPLGGMDAGQGVRELVNDPSRPAALCLMHGSTISRVGLHPLQHLDAIDAGGEPLTAAYNSLGELLVVAAAPPTLRLQKNGSWQVRELTEEPRGAALDPISDEVWLLPGTAGSPIRVHDATTLEPKREIACNGRPSAIRFTVGLAWLLDKDAGQVTMIDTATGTRKGTIAVGERLSDMLPIGPHELWVAAASGRLLVYDPTAGELIRSVPTAGSPSSLVYVP
jgi:hypothetical protein